MNHSLVVFTIVKNGLPSIFWHLPMLQMLPPEIKWRWIIVEGQASNTNCTSWCANLETVEGDDGTTAYLEMISSHPNVKIISKPLWSGGKLEMCNAAVSEISEPCILLQVDSDEFYTPETIVKIIQLFTDYPQAQRAYFYCRFFVGLGIITTGKDCYGNKSNEWLRAFRFIPGQKWQSHEPPILNHNRGDSISREITFENGITFDHWAYVFESNVAWKCAFYGYEGGLEKWKSLQKNTQWPVTSLKSFLPWVDAGAGADKLSS